MIKIAVNGYRSDRNEWEAVQKVPKEQLPALTPEQRRVAEAQRIPEELYQRSAVAGQRTAEKLLKKTEWFAKVLQKELAERAPEAAINSVVLDARKEKFDIAVAINGTEMPLHIEERIVDELFDLGSTDAGQRLSTMLDRCFHRLGVS
jgi:hypothetical protein